MKQNAFTQTGLLTMLYIMLNVGLMMPHRLELDIVLASHGNRVSGTATQ
jgi:hypothetical protein